jgi:protein involved in polysaccharide export with SLBB domain
MEPLTWEGDTVAVNVMDWPAADGFADDVSVTVEGAVVTVWVVEAVQLPYPL